MNISPGNNQRSIYTSAVLILLMLITVFQSTIMHAQSLEGVDLKSVEIDDLTDAQIESYWEQAKSKGLTLSQMETLARQRGVSELQLSKLRTRIQGLSGVSPTSKRSTPSVASRNVNTIVGGGSFEINENLPELSEEEKRLFGYGLFKRRSLSFAPNLNLPTPVDYVLGPGDELLIDLWGTTQQFFKFTVSAEGAIRPNKLSPIYVNGLTISAAEAKIINRLSQIYKGLKKTKDQEPTIFHQVSLGKIRTINIEVVGAVETPGIYALPSLATVYAGIHASGGPNLSGTFRNIRLIRNNELKAVIDIYDFLTTGVKVGDERLQDGDIIIVPPYGKRVALEGEVKIRGLFEMVEGESLMKALSFASGFRNRAFKELITVKRNGDVEKEIFDVNARDYGSFIPEDGDYIEVSQILNRFANRVVIDGAVYRVGEYQLTDALSLLGLIEKSGGLRADAFLNRATIYRTNDDFSRFTIPVDLGALLKGTIEDIPLQREDHIKVNSIYDLKEEFYVEISGEVGKEGIYTFFNNMTVQDLIVLSGGLLESASNSLIEISRRSKFAGLNEIADIITLSIDSNLDLSVEDMSHRLSPFDKVYVRSIPGYSEQKEITVEGEVLVPGRYTLAKKDERISDVIARAQGLTPYAYPSGAVLIRETEFATKQNMKIENRAHLNQLRARIIQESSGIKTQDRDELLKVLDRIEAKQTPNVSYDRLGSQFKKRSLGGFEKRDSLVTDVGISDSELVAIDLDKVMENPGSVYDLVMRPGDIISIPGKLETVRITGEVLSPVSLRYDGDYSFKDYVFSSGGFSQNSKRSQSYVIYPNGGRKGVKKFLWFKKYPKVTPGSTIVIGQKPERNPISLQSVLATAGSLATLALVIDRLGN